MRIKFYNQKFIVTGYLLAGIFFTTTAVSAFCTLTAPLPELQIVSSSTQGVTPVPNIPLISLVIPQDETSLRDPFVQGEVKVSAVGHKVDVLDPSGIRVKAIILSLKSGVVLEDARSGAVYFLSQGESAGGILVKSISKSGVSVEVDGKQIDLMISGGQ